MAPIHNAYEINLGDLSFVAFILIAVVIFLLYGRKKTIKKILDEYDPGIRRTNIKTTEQIREEVLLNRAKNYFMESSEKTAKFITDSKIDDSNHAFLKKAVEKLTSPESPEISRNFDSVASLFENIITRTDKEGIKIVEDQILKHFNTLLKKKTYRPDDFRHMLRLADICLNIDEKRGKELISTALKYLRDSKMKNSIKCSREELEQLEKQVREYVREMCPDLLNNDE